MTTRDTLITGLKAGLLGEDKSAAEKLAAKVVDCLMSLEQDCHMALNGSWDRGDAGFEDTLTVIENTLGMIASHAPEVPAEPDTMTAEDWLAQIDSLFVDNGWNKTRDDHAPSYENYSLGLTAEVYPGDDVVIEHEDHGTVLQVGVDMAIPVLRIYFDLLNK